MSEAESKLVLGVNEAISNRDYHADKFYLSSTPLKEILKDTQKFYKDYVLGEKRSERKDVFDEGSYVHSLLLEPEKVAQEYAFFEGQRKFGFAYEHFVKNNPGKTILSVAQKERCERYVQAAAQTEAAKKLLTGGVAEQTTTAVLQDVPVKARFDYINIQEGYIADVKTTGQSSGPEFFYATVQQFHYDLSGALYCAVAEQAHGKPFTFYYIVVSKADGTCLVYRTSWSLMELGKHKLDFALARYKSCKESDNWTHVPYEPPKLDVIEL